MNVKREKLDEKLKAAVCAYDSSYKKLIHTEKELYCERKHSVELIELNERLINSIAHRPKSFDKLFETVKTNKKKFTDVEEFARKEAGYIKATAGTAAAGVAAGSAVAALGPSAAMWVATTFGTASTGTAISALSGAAATKAALAWIGGGALAAGGGGTAAGSAFLAMCGPVGWGIAGAAVLTSAVILAVGKHKASQKKKEQIEELTRYTYEVRKIRGKVKALLDENTAIADSLYALYLECLEYINCDFNLLSEEEQLKLGELVNNTMSLSAAIIRTVEV